MAKRIDEPNIEEGELGIIEQDIKYCSNCIYKIEANEE
jgi:hypothetical protein